MAEGIAEDGKSYKASGVVAITAMNVPPTRFLGSETSSAAPHLLCLLEKKPYSPPV